MENNQEHFDPTNEIGLDVIKKRALKGVAVLTGRTLILNVISLVATGLLTVFLNPSDLGIFWIVSAIVNFFAYFSDVGLAAALIQKKEQVSDEDLYTTFTVQQVIVIGLLILLYLISPILQNRFFISDDGTWLLYALGVSLLMSSLKTVPSILMERDLDFSKLVIPQLLENLAFNITAVVLAWKGFGVSSFTYAVIIRGLTGLIAIYILKPWLPKIRFIKSSFKRLMTFGVAYQTNTLLAAIKDDGMTAFLGSILGNVGVGYLGWAQKWAYMPLRLFMDHVLKVTFPAFSRMQDNYQNLKASLERSIFFICFLVFPSIIGLIIITPILMKVIPRYEKWEPAYIPLVLIGVNAFMAASTTQLTNLLNSIGKIKTTFRLMIMWTALTWIVVPYLALNYSVNGAALGYAIVGTSSVIAIFIVYRIINFSIYKSIVIPAIASMMMAVLLLGIRLIYFEGILSVMILVITGGISYIVISYLMIGPSIFKDAKKVITAVFSK